MIQLQMDNLEGTLVIMSQGFTSVSFRLAKVFVEFCDEEKESWVVTFGKFLQISAS